MRHKGWHRNCALHQVKALAHGAKAAVIEEKKQGGKSVVCPECLKLARERVLSPVLLCAASWQSEPSTASVWKPLTAGNACVRLALAYPSPRVFIVFRCASCSTSGTL